MIITEVMCGMGNQMFQYAFARALQEACRKQDEIQFQLITASRMHDGREYALKHCVLRQDIRIPSRRRQQLIDLKWKMKLKLLKRKLGGRECFDALVKHNIYHSESVFRYFGLPAAAGRDVYINGWWQSPKYFEEIAGDIRKELQIQTTPSPENQRMLASISDSAYEAVCVHVRRGDYLSDKFSKELEICGEDYYRKAFDIIRSKVSNPHFFIFSMSSADILWIQEHWHFPEDCTWVCLDNPDYEELRLMYSCKHFILANSTFSWWAAYLSQNREQVCVAPSVWNRRDTDFADLYMDHWTVVPVK